MDKQGSLDPVEVKTDNTIITVNVGGTHFQTYKDTLIRCNYFKNMFKGTFKPASDVLFVDRDPTLFRHILNYLRYGSEQWNELNGLIDHKLHQLLMFEAKFFGIDDFNIYHHFEHSTYHYKYIIEIADVNVIELLKIVATINGEIIHESSITEVKEKSHCFNAPNIIYTVHTKIFIIETDDDDFKKNVEYYCESIKELP